MSATDPKEALRAAVATARAALTPSDRESRDRARTELVLSALPRDVAVVAAYCSVPGEPGTTAMIDGIVASGRRVLLPVLHRTPDWAWFDSWDETPPGPLGIPSPLGPRLGATSLAEADLVIVPCLSVSRTGGRLGTGGGWYDRALPHRRAGAPVWALAGSEELVDELPTLPHDVMVDAVLTELGLEVLSAR